MGYAFTRAHQLAVARRRRTVLQYDVINIIEENNTAPLREADDFAGFVQRAFDVIDHVPNQIDSVCWDMMYAGDAWAMYPSRLLPRRRTGRFGRWADEGHDIFAEMVRGGQARGLENILVHRISEADIDRDTHPDSHKQAHPEMYIKSWMSSGLHNLSIPEIRERKVRHLAECMENYAFDGLQIDFCRHTPFLPPGQQWALRGHVTELMRMLREMLLALEAADGRPRLLCARVPETVEGCAQDGLDIAEWGREGVIDCLTVGSRSYRVDLPGFRRALAGAPVKLFPCEDEHHCVDGYADAPLHVLRGVFANWWDQGADGIALFNWYGARPEVYEATSNGRFTMSAHNQVEAIQEAGDPERLRHADKAFVVERRGGYPWEDGFANNSRGKPLPAALPNDGRGVEAPLYVADREGSAKLVLVLHGLGDADTLRVTVNGFMVDIGDIDRAWTDRQIMAPNAERVSGYHVKDLPEIPGQRLARVEAPLPAGFLIKGENIFDIGVLREGYYPYCATVSLERLEVHIQHA